MGDAAADLASLSVLFGEVWLLQRYVSKKSDQDEIRSVLVDLRKCDTMVKKLGLLNIDGNKEDLPHENLKYLLISYLLGKTALMVTDEDRDSVEQFSYHYFKEFIDLCEVYVPDCVSEDDLEWFRNDEIGISESLKAAQLNRTKAAHAKLLEVVERGENFPGNDLLNNREAVLACISCSICKAFVDLGSLAEKQKLGRKTNDSDLVENTPAHGDDPDYLVMPIAFREAMKDMISSTLDCPSGKECLCALISIVNALTLRQPSHPAHPMCGNHFEVDGKPRRPGSLEFEFLRKESVLNYVTTYLDYELTKIKSEYGDSYESDRKCITEVLESLPRMMHLDVGLDSPTRIQGTKERWLFGYLGINLLHGWLVDPQKEKDTYDAIGSSYVSELKTKSRKPEFKMIADFLAGTKKTQLTAYGLTCLRSEVKERGLAILYNNGHYRVIYNHQGTLFYLIADSNDLLKFHDCYWKSLELDDEDAFYLTSKFLPVEKQPNIDKAKKWLAEDIAETERRLDVGPDKKITKSKRRHKKDATGQGSTSVDKESAESAHESKEDEGARREDDIESTRNKFDDFLYRFRTCGSDVPYFEGMVKLLEHLGILVMKFPYEFIKEHDKKLTMTIQDHYERVKESLRLCVAEYLVVKKLHISLKLDKADVLLGANLEIVGLPDPKSIQSFVDFVSQNDV